MFRNSTQLSLKLNLEFNKIYKFWGMLFCVILFLVIGVILSLAYRNDSVTIIFVWAIIIITLIVFPFVHNRSTRKRIEKIMRENPLQDENNINNFVFENDVVIITDTRFEKVVSNITVPYDNMPKIIEHKDNLYIFLGHNQATILTKSGMTEGSFDDLKVFLKSKLNSKKYKIFKF